MNAVVFRACDRGLKSVRLYSSSADHDRDKSVFLDVEDTLRFVKE
jgi:hypothetical protein